MWYMIYVDYVPLKTSLKPQYATAKAAARVTEGEAFARITTAVDDKPISPGSEG